MRKRSCTRIAFFLALLPLAGCAGGALSGADGSPAGPQNTAGEAPLSPEADPTVPGMIPKECELLLNKSEEWGHAMAVQSWKPESATQGLEVAQFFSTFHLVPESTSRFTQAWLGESAPETDAAAKQSLERMARAQTCDLMLAHKLLLGVLGYGWGKEERAKVSGYLHSFVLNQQARVAPSLARAVQLDVLARMAKKKWIRADAAAIQKLKAWFDAETAKGLQRAQNIPSDREQWKLNREELQLSQEARERLGKILPLP